MKHRQKFSAKLINNDLVSFSRAGDIFHYRWAARRCLRLIRPKTLLSHIVVEGSDEPSLPGEYVIDLTEYTNTSSEDFQNIEHYQLKHTTVKKNQPFTLSNLRNTISGFAKRFKSISNIKDDSKKNRILAFTIVTNRPIADSFKRNIKMISTGGKVDQRFKAILKNYTKLNDKDLHAFCKLLKLVDGEGDYATQHLELRREISHLLAGTVDTAKVDSIVALVADKVLPNSDGRIDREDVLKRFGVTSERELYPAPPEFENLKQVIPRKQNEELLNRIINSTMPVIVHAEGGVGKSVFARQIVDSLPLDSFGIVYDSFGGGRYRNRSEPRHRHRDALVQISNELAYHGLCDPLIRLSSDLEDELLRAFLVRLETSVRSIKRINKDGLLVILIDAADNAEMAARESNQRCFANELLRESMPDGCRLVMLCRTERVKLLNPPSNVIRLELKAFSQEETLIHLNSRYPNAHFADSIEFHRLTNNGNPRVQAYALGLELPTVAETLKSMGPAGTSVNQQIESQLDAALSIVKEKFPDNYQGHIDAICYGLANLPPFIPIKILAQAAQVDESTIKSFITDLGRPLWLSDTAVHFRDEPTETWFRSKFSALPDQIASYIKQIEPLALEYPYVAETLPSLYLNAGRYKELIELALTDKFLPKGNPIDERSVRIYRLQFAFKAALKSQKYADATKLAMRAGEEVAGDKRQLELLRKNVDLIAPLQYEQKVQELAFRRTLRSKWEGSENVYSASLLSSVEGFQGEARGYLRASIHWLNIYFESRKNRGNNHSEDKFTYNDIEELAFSIFNLDGIEKLIDFVLSWKPPNIIYQVSRNFFKRLIDAGNFAAIDEACRLIRSKQEIYIVYIAIALARTLMDIGRIPDRKFTQTFLSMLVSKPTVIAKTKNSYDEMPLSAILSFVEACVANKNSKRKVLQVLNFYFPLRASGHVGSNFQTKERATYLRALALRCALENSFELDFNKLFPKQFLEKKKTHRYGQEKQEFKDRVSGLLPWYLIRARILSNEITDLVQAAKEVEEKVKGLPLYRYSDSMPYEISYVLVDILTLYRSSDTTQIENFFAKYLKDDKHVRIKVWLKAVRGAFRSDHLLGMRQQLEVITRNLIFSLKDETPETKADLFIDLARAVLALSVEDAASYFNFAIEAVSKFGDELRDRWEAIIALAKRSAEDGHLSAEIAHRFIQCAEMVGDYIGDEDHWDRNMAIRTQVQLSPNTAIASLSRWRDREVGWFDDQLPILAEELVRNSYVSPSVGWSLSTFFNTYYIDDYASLCIEREASKEKRKIILDMAVRDLRLNEATEESLRKLKNVANQHSISNNSLDNLLAFYEANRKNVEEITSSKNNNVEYIDWKKIFDSLDLTSDSGINQAIQRYKAAPIQFHNRVFFWEEALKRIEENSAIKFLKALIESENADRYDIQTVLSSIPREWHQKISFKESWGMIIEYAAQHLALELIKPWSLEYFLQNIEGRQAIKPYVQQGVLKGLSSSIEVEDASIFFGFTGVVVPSLSPQETTILLDYALERFELHIDANFGDGRWAEWLNPPKDIVDAVTGLIWSALGSPSAQSRWRAAHCVRRLAELECEPEVGALVEWMRKDRVEAFGSNKFPFYNLNARQYLLIAFARISIDNPKILLLYSDLFAQIALESTPHILIQTFAAKIALNIEKSFPATYGENIVARLNKVGISELPVRELKTYNDHIDSYLHEKGLVDISSTHLHGWDFDRYWFEPLGRVFGISGEQVGQLATNVLVKDWKVEYKGSYENDPRDGLWRSSRNERKTWHDHGSYPQTERYNFYLSYHSMLAVAAKLLANMPIVFYKGGAQEDTWSNWFSHHFLTRKDGYWLADRRDPAPILKPMWRRVPKSQDWAIDDKEWLSQITADHFLNTILFNHNGETWMRLHGSWEEQEAEREEKYSISSALVSSLASRSLLNMLTAASDPYDHKLPDYQEERMEYATQPFELQGWIGCELTDNNLDEFDPFAAEIAYPPYEIGQSFINQLGLVSDLHKREWFLSETNKLAVLSELWKTNKSGYNQDPLRHGGRISASLSFLKSVCVSLGVEIILKVHIGRGFKYDSYAYRKYESENGYSKPYQKIYLLSADGKLRDTEAVFHLRE